MLDIKDRSTADARAPGIGNGSAVGGPVRFAWAEGTLTRAKELEALAQWLSTRHESPEHAAGLCRAMDEHLAAARDATSCRTKRWQVWRRTSAPMLERAISNLDAAEANLLQAAPAEYLVGQMPCLLNQVQRHLPRTDPRRTEFERIAQELGVKDPDHSLLKGTPPKSPQEKRDIVDLERNKLVSVVRGASSAGLREQLRVRSFRNVLLATAFVTFLLAAGLALLGAFRPATVPLCFLPEKEGTTLVVCPTSQAEVAPTGTRSRPTPSELDEKVKQTAGRWDLFIVELIGLTAAAVAAAAAIRNIRGSSEPHDLPVALAALKLPTGAITAVLGLLLMRGQFVPGLSALDTTGQILAWGLLFGYAQQLFTRFVDQQANTVLGGVRGAQRPDPAPAR